MAKATATPAKSVVTEWVKVFPKQAAETYTGSVNFMKQLTVVAVSTITYLKNLFPQDNYTNETFAGLNLTILKKNCEDELAQFVSNALLQASDAFEKKYLHQLALCLYSGECSLENLVEYYVFEYSYSGACASMNVNVSSRARGKLHTDSDAFTFENIRNQTVNLIRTCTLNVKCNQPVSQPETTDISLRLYYNDDAPVGYQAPGFVAPLESLDHLAPTSGARLSFGAVETEFHRLVANMYTRDLVSSNDVNPTQNPPTLSEVMDLEGGMEQLSTQAPTLRCPCNMTDIDNTCAILVCKYCGYGGHAVCYGVVCARADHCCDRCADLDVGTARRPTDCRLQQLQPKKRAGLCILRRVLWLCRHRKEMSAPMLVSRFSISHLNACRLMKYLREYGVVATQDNNEVILSPKKVIHKELQQVIHRNFQNEDIVERLVAETQPTDDADPVGDVLQPMEKIDLRNSTTLGQIVKPTQSEKLIENSTLQQYREAILSNEEIEEELPLSGNHNPVKDMEKIGKKITKRKSSDDTKPRVAIKTKRAKRN